MTLLTAPTGGCAGPAARPALGLQPFPSPLAPVAQPVMGERPCPQTGGDLGGPLGVQQHLEGLKESGSV